MLYIKGITLLAALLFQVIPILSSSAEGEGTNVACAKLTVGPNGTMLLDGKPWCGIGVNYYDAFARVLANPADTSYQDGFKVLQKYGIPFIRFNCGGYWPKDWELYRQNPEQYFKLLDEFVHQAELHQIGLIPSLFWYYAAFPDLSGEPMDAYGDIQSKTNQAVRKYTHEIITRYRNSPAIWGWEYGNEYNLSMDIADGEKFWPHVIPSLGTALSRSKRDDITFPMIATTLKEFAQEARKEDPHHLLISGHSIMRNAAWHLWK
jgi:hypothetical protein